MQRQVRRREEAADRRDRREQRSQQARRERATIGPRQPTAMTRKIALSSDVAAAVAGCASWRRPRTAVRPPAIATRPPIRRPRPTSAARRRLGERACRRDTSRAAACGEHREQRDRDAAPRRRPLRRAAVADGEARRRDPVPDEPTRQRLREPHPGPDARRRAEERDDRRLPTRSCGGPGLASRRSHAGGRSPAHAAARRAPSCRR